MVSKAIEQMSKPVRILTATAFLMVLFIVAALSAAWPSPPSDRAILAEAVREYEKAAPPKDRLVPWDIFCQQAAQGYYDDALASVRLSTHDDDTQYSLIALARIRARNGDAAGALAVARTYAKAATRAKAIEQVAIARAWRGDIKGALGTAGELTNSSDALQQIAVVEANRGHLQAARIIVAGIASPDDALQAIAEYQIKSGDFAAALGTAEQMDPSSTGNLLGDAADELKKRGELGRARNLAAGLKSRDLAASFLWNARYAESADRDIPVLRADPCEEAYFAAAQPGGFIQAAATIVRQNCDHSYPAIEEFGFDPTAAEKLLFSAPKQWDLCFGLTEFAKLSAAKKDIANAVRYISKAQSACYGHPYRSAGIREVARAWTIQSGPKPALAWSRALPTPAEREVALLGVAEAMGRPHP